MITSLRLNFKKPVTLKNTNNQSKPLIMPSAGDTFVSRKQDLTFKGKDPNKETIDWYEKNAEAYFAETKDFSMRDKYPLFLKYIPEGGRILDAGCGSGRDSKAFSEMGYEVTAIEASKKLANLAKSHTGVNVINTTFAKFKSDERFDGIWACTSLLHVPKKDFNKSLTNLTDHLKPGGVMWVYLKEGLTEEKDSKGRFFNYVSQEEMEKIISTTKGLKLIEVKNNENEFRKGDHPFIGFAVKKS